MVSIADLKNSELGQGLDQSYWELIPTNCEYCLLPLDISVSLTSISCLNPFCPSVKIGKITKLLTDLGKEVATDDLVKVASNPENNIAHVIESIEGLPSLIEELPLDEFIKLFIGFEYSDYVDDLIRQKNIESLDTFLRYSKDFSELQELLIPDNLDDSGREIVFISVTKFYQEILENEEIMIHIKK